MAGRSQAGNAGSERSFLPKASEFQMGSIQAERTMIADTSEQPAMSVSGAELAADRPVSRAEEEKGLGPDRRPEDAVLVVGADPDVVEEVRVRLEGEGHPVRVSQTIQEALRTARSGWPSALIVDRALKEGEDGLEVVEALREERNFIPVLVLGPPASADERIRQFKAGADQFLPKPFDGREIVPRVEALLRRAADPRARLQCGEIEMDLVERSVRCAGRQVDLLPTEFKLLEYLIRRPEQSISRAKLLEDVWNSRYDARSNVVDVQIGNLRRKLDPTGERRYIVNVRGVGFKLTGAP
jgi:two-component system, OmpR family, response regulator